MKREQPDPATQVVHTSQTPSIEDISVPQLVKISIQDVTTEMDGIWTDIQSVVYNLQAETSDPGQKGQFYFTPNNELKELYIRILGTNREEQGSMLMLGGVIKGRVFVEAVVAAAIYNLVWNRELPWNGPKEVLELLGEESEHLNRVLSRSECSFNLHTMVWQAAYLKVTDQEFKEATIRPHARRLATTFMMVVNGLLKRIWPKKPAKHAFWASITDHVTNIFMRALVLKGQVRGRKQDCSSLYETAFKLTGNHSLLDQSFTRLLPIHLDRERPGI